ncbi:hypothetical protein N752_27770 [Desulforamulus aquiferis]|nr:response regulator [Desulforamulus aquiferis]RYD01926.1 hypothetical protein N752_27770 [Desulforamulus aquiferis]
MELLENSYEFLKVIVNELPEGIMILSAKGEIILVNSFLLKLLGYSNSQIENINLHDILSSKIFKNKATSLSNSTGYKELISTQKKDGTPIRVYATIKPFQFKGQSYLLASIKEPDYESVKQLSMAIAKQIAQFAGGKTGFNYAEEYGGEFWLNIPIADANSDSVLEVESKITLGIYGNNAQEVNTKILIAEDEPVSQMILKKMINKLGYSCEIVESGEQAVQEAASNNYALIFMDCLLKGMDGYEATRSIRLMESNLNSHIPIIALTSYNTHEDRNKCLKAGMNDYLNKPVDYQLLSQILNKWVPQKVEFPLTNNLSQTELSSLYLSNLPNQVAALKEALESGDSLSLARHTHNLKTSGTSIGSQELIELTKQLDEAICSGLKTAISEIISRISLVCNELLSVNFVNHNKINHQAPSLKGKATVKDVLVVDDDPVVINYLSLGLKYEGYNVYTARSGAETMEHLRKITPSAVILDWVLPDTTGIDICRRLKSLCNPVVLMLTGKGEVEDRIEGLRRVPMTI